jgi:hypothetical protein
MEAWMSGKKHSCEEHPKVHQLASTVVTMCCTAAHLQHACREFIYFLDELDRRVEERASRSLTAVLTLLALAQ